MEVICSVYRASLGLWVSCLDTADMRCSSNQRMTTGYSNTREMPRLVFDFGAKRMDPVIQALQKLLAHSRQTIFGRLQNEPSYENLEDSLVAVASRLGDGDLASLVVIPEIEDIRYAFVNCPKFECHPRSTWIGTVEYVGTNYKKLWDDLLTFTGLRFVSVGFEKGLDLDDQSLGADSFPWNNPSLVLAAVRTGGEALEAWRIERGPAYCKV